MPVIRTLLGQKKIDNIRAAAAGAARLDGDTAELGVYRGGISRLIAELLPNKKHYAFDTFSGIPEINPEIDKVEKGEFSGVDMAELYEYLDLPNIIIKKGFFPRSVGSGMGEIKFSLVHFDGDTHKSCRDFLEYFYPRMVNYGYMIFDDYNRSICPGVKIATDKFFKDKKENILITTLGQGMIRRVIL